MATREAIWDKKDVRSGIKTKRKRRGQKVDSKVKAGVLDGRIGQHRRYQTLRQIWLCRSQLCIIECCILTQLFNRHSNQLNTLDLIFYNWYQ